MSKQPLFKNPLSWFVLILGGLTYLFYWNKQRANDLFVETARQCRGNIDPVQCVGQTTAQSNDANNWFAGFLVVFILSLIAWVVVQITIVERKVDR